MIAIVGLDLRTGASWTEFTVGDASEARDQIARLAHARRAARDEWTGSYPPIIHGIRRIGAPVNPQ